jgi:hypothetical protein
MIILYIICMILFTINLILAIIQRNISGVGGWLCAIVLWLIHAIKI